jgi:hypothetical protein
LLAGTCDAVNDVICPWVVDTVIRPVPVADCTDIELAIPQPYTPFMYEPIPIVMPMIRKPTTSAIAFITAIAYIFIYLLINNT